MFVTNDLKVWNIFIDDSRLLFSYRKRPPLQLKELVRRLDGKQAQAMQPANVASIFQPIWCIGDRSQNFLQDLSLDEIEKLLIHQQTLQIGGSRPIWAFHVRTYQTSKAVYFASILLFITTLWFIIAHFLTSTERNNGVWTKNIRHLFCHSNLRVILYWLRMSPDKLP